MFALLQACSQLPISFLELGGERRPLLIAASGVAQGCPLWGTIWAIVLDLLVKGIVLEFSRLLRACADDLGIILTALHDLCTLVPQLVAAKRTGGS